MKLITLSLGTALACFASGAYAQEHSMQGHGTTAMELPKACATANSTTPGMSGMEAMDSATQTMSAGQKALMQGMMETQGPMMAGMMAEDTDIAFICGMIPHHQGAINMARAELEHGDSEWAKNLARRIIADQEKEIAEMTEWLEKQGQ